jgi:hypothetical protein
MDPSFPLVFDLACWVAAIGRRGVEPEADPMLAIRRGKVWGSFVTL